ncbi:lactosylceramide 4-alpha-galactosyltransferase-like [Populus alba x Populus x berolinensis]|uniref:Lactosylceramide 4-alpha-galactosyltransferase-like n=2 Tax=Populus alba x Populus x berolinensis TaxID=444605 RepID=A0AAD6LKI8_9ROSI|nr:lactosylceramide 4-alpha-galactosyltransferase-like [Populus alba x Populus x berolinensis]
MMRKVSHKMFDHQQLCRARTPTLSAIAVTVTIFFVYANSIISTISLQSSSVSTKEISGELHVRITERQIMSTVVNQPLRSMQEEIKEVDRGEHRSSVIPPFNLTVEERIEWFRKRLPEFEILKADNLTKEFLGRVLEFFNNECDVQFFMTWISPVESFGRREFLALESLFKVHPHGCLLILSRDLDSIQGYRILKPLLDRKFRVAAITPDLSFLFKNTPAETWFEEIKSGNKDPGEIPFAQNLSNLIRLAVLYKFGGIYLDTDFIVLKSFADLRNAIGAQSIDVSRSWTRLNNAVLVFDMNHPLLLKFIEEFASTFDGNKWGHNGPYLVSRVVQRVAERPGYNFTILPPMAFYPVGWNRIDGFFKKPENKVESRWVNAKLLQLSGETYGIHLWNRQSSRFSIEEGSVMGRLISDHCVICEYKYSS